MLQQYRYAVSYSTPVLSHSAHSRKLDQGLGVPPPLFPTTTMSSYSLSPYRSSHILSPARSTPSLDDNIDDSLFFSPPETYLDTPDLPAYDWKEIRKLEDRKLYLEERETAALGLYDGDVDVELPSLADVSSNKAPLPSELPSAPSSWQPTTISPAEAFYDYEEVCRFLAEQQARPSSPSVYSACSSCLVTPYSETKELPPIDDDDLQTYPVVVLPSESAVSSLLIPPEGTPSPTKRPRGEEDDGEYDADEVHEDSDDDEDHLSSGRSRPPKRRRFGRDDVPYSDYVRRTPEREQALDDDESGEFNPRASYSNKKHKSSRGPPRRTVVKSNVLPKIPSKPRHVQTHGKAEDTYRLGPCDCRQPKCTSCEMTCWYTFVRGPRKGQLCRRLFDSGRHLDLRRHKISHAVNEWQMLENGEITLEEAWWYAVEHNCEHKGLICPNGDCTTTFTRYDALRRHMERQTCPYWHLSTYPSLDSRSIKARIEQDSREKYARISASKKHS